MGSMGEVVAKFGADISNFAEGLARMAMLSAGTGGLIAAALIGAGVAIVGVGVASAMMAGTFQQGVNRLVTGAGDVTDNMQKMGQSILSISTATGIMTGPLLSSMYQIISAGQRGAQAENTLAVAAKGAVAEQANVVAVAKALTTVMTDYGTKQYNATQYMNGYTRATQLGKLSLEQLSTSLGPILPLAQNLGIHFADVAGAMSTMTNAGIPAQQAATSLRFAFQSLENPTHKAMTAMADMGLSSVAVGNELKVSLPGALEMIYNAAKKAGPEGSVPFNRAVSDMIGGQRSLQAFLSLTGTHFKTFSNDTKAITDAMNASKTSVLGWDTAQKNFNVQLDRGKAAIAAAGIAIGTQLLPVLTGIAQKVVPIVVAFADWVVKSHIVTNALAVLKQIGDIVFAGIMIVMPSVIQLWTAFMAVLGQIILYFQRNQGALDALKMTLMAVGVVIGVLVLTAVLALGLALVVLGAAFVAVALVVKAVMDVCAAWAAIAPTLGGVWNATIAYIISLWTTLETAAVDVWNRTGAAISAAVSAVVQFVIDRWNNLSSAAVDVWGRIGQAINSATSAIGNAIQSAWSAVISWLIGQWNTLSSAAVDVWNRMTSAIVNVLSGLAGRVSGPIHAAISAIMGILQGAIGLAMNAGAAIVRGVANGIMSGIGWVANAVSSVVSRIASMLPHSPAKEGPLSKLDEFGPALTSGFARGIERGTPEVTAAANKMVGSIPTGGNLTSSGGRSATNATYIIQINGQDLIRALGPGLASELRLVIGGV